MPTNPLDSILDRDLSIVIAKDTIDIACPLLKELVNYSTNALVRCVTSIRGKENEDLAAITLYYHIIEMTDGIEVLLSQACSIPAIPLVRSSFEALISLEYILEKDYLRRSLAWLQYYVRQRLSIYEKLNPATDRGKQFQAVILKDNVKLPMPDIAVIQNAQTNLDKMLARAQMQTVVAEYKRSKKQSKRNPEWYQLFNGPGNLSELAKHVGRGSQYELLYRYWSQIAHANDLSRFIDRTEQGEPAIGRLRKPDNLGGITIVSATFLLGATRSFLHYFRPEEDLSNWYKSEIQEPYNQIIEMHNFEPNNP